MDAVAEIDALVEAAHADPNRLTSVWRAASALPRWWFLLQRGNGEEHLYVGTLSGEPYFCAFTSMKRVSDFARQNGLCHVEDEVPSVAMTPAGFLDVADEFHARGVTGIAFDHGINGFFAPLCNLRDLHSLGGDRPGQALTWQSRCDRKRSRAVV